jgi:hypothetical protein
MCTENEYGQDSDYEDFKERKQGGQIYFGNEINSEKKIDGNINMKTEKIVMDRTRTQRSLELKFKGKRPMG